MGQHFIAQCKHGTIVTQCRCPSRDKTVRIVPCPSHCRHNIKTKNSCLVCWTPQGCAEGYCAGEKPYYYP